MRLIPVAISLALILAACASEEIPPLEPQAFAPPTAPTNAIARPPQANRDQCGASDLQGLVGKPRTEIPVPLYPDRQRVACTACPVTEDYSPERLDIFFDATTGLITEVRCG